jgi:hypothetical protein
MRVTRTSQDQQAAEVAVSAARSHLRVLVLELEQTLERVGAKAERMADDR